MKQYFLKATVWVALGIVMVLTNGCDKDDNFLTDMNEVNIDSPVFDPSAVVTDSLGGVVLNQDSLQAEIDKAEAMTKSNRRSGN